MNRPAAIDVSATISASLDGDTARLVADLAAKRGQSIQQFAAEAIRRVAENEAEFDAFIQLGSEKADRGELIPHEEAMAELDQMIAKHEARCRN